MQTSQSVGRIRCTHFAPELAWLERTLAGQLGAAIYFRGGLVAEPSAALEGKSAPGQKQQANVRFSSQWDEPLAGLANNLQYFYCMEAEHGLRILDLRQGLMPALPAIRPNYVRVPFTLAIEGD